MSKLKAAIAAAPATGFATRDGAPDPADFDDKSKAMEKVRERLDEIATSAATTASEKAIAAAGESMLADMDKRFENLDDAIRKDIEETVSAAIKQALVAAKKVEAGGTSSASSGSTSRTVARWPSWAGRSTRPAATSACRT